MGWSTNLQHLGFCILFYTYCWYGIGEKGVLWVYLCLSINNICALMMVVCIGINNIVIISPISTHLQELDGGTSHVGYIGYRFPLSLYTIWGNHLPFNFMLKFPIYYLEKPLPITSKWRRVTVRKWKVEHPIIIKNEMKKNCSSKPPTLEIKNQNKGMKDILDIDSHCPYLLSGETTFHLTSC